MAEVSGAAAKREDFAAVLRSLFDACEMEEALFWTPEGEDVVDEAPRGALTELEVARVVPAREGVVLFLVGVLESGLRVDLGVNFGDVPLGEDAGLAVRAEEAPDFLVLEFDSELELETMGPNDFHTALTVGPSVFEPGVDSEGGGK